MLPHPAMVEHLRNADKLKLFTAFSEDYESDLPTARAAAGALAMATGLDDEELINTMIMGGKGEHAAREGQVARTLIALLKSGNPELVHRAAHGICASPSPPFAFVFLFLFLFSFMFHALASGVLYRQPRGCAQGSLAAQGVRSGGGTHKVL